MGTCKETIKNWIVLSFLMVSLTQILSDREVQLMFPFNKVKILQDNVDHHHLETFLEKEKSPTFLETLPTIPIQRDLQVHHNWTTSSERWYNTPSILELSRSDRS